MPKKKENKKFQEFILIGAIITISIADLFANVLSGIPVLGFLAETASEFVLEIIQLALVFGLIKVVKK